MKIGILGGTFNPIHLGHLHLAMEVRSRLRFDQILFIPSGIPPHKEDEQLASPSDRLEMVRLALLEFPYLKVSDIEIRRPGRSYTIETIRTLKKEQPADEFYFIIGLDAFLEIESWKEPAALLESVHFVIVSRPGFHFRQLTRLPPFSATPVSALAELDQDIRRRLDLQIGTYPLFILLRIDPHPISSSEIREKIKNKEHFDNNLLPESVKSFIMKKRIFF